MSFYSTSDGELLAGEGEYNDLKYKLFYKKDKVENINEFENKLESIKNSTDAFYMVNDPLYNKTRFEQLSEFCKKNKIVLMTSFPTLVKLGATFAVSPDYSKIGVLTGNMINRILKQESSCKQEGVVLPDQSSLYVNKEYSEASGIELPEVVLERARLTRLFTVGVNLMNEEKYKSAKIVFETILKRDPENKPAETYLQLLIEKLTKSKTDEIMARADKHFETRNFALAAQEYQSVLKINPNITIAAEKYKESILGQSESQRAQAAAYVANGDPFNAIKTYQAAIATLPTNTRATSELASLRSSEMRKIPVYLSNGIDEYNKRNYESSILIFENILLVDPQNKQAIEYLRLSTKKQEAIQRLKKKLNK
jgi:tetratricopeptide (TPR) repeat protein